MASVASSTPDARHVQLIAASAQANEARVRDILAEDFLGNTRHDQDALRLSVQKVAARGNLAVTRLLLEKGADVEPRRDSEMPAIYKAAEAGHFAVVNELLLFHANPNAPVRSRLGQTALFPAAFRGHNKVVEVLLRRGADVRVRDKDGRTPLLYLASEKEKAKWNMDTMRLLIDGGANLEARDNIGRTALLWAATNGNLQLVEALFDGSLGRHAIADVSAANNRGRSALHMAAEDNFEDMVRLLLKRKADPNATSDGGWTPLHNAAQNGHAGVVEQLLAAHANVNAELSNGMTALHWAAFNGHEAVVELLLRCDETNLDIKDSFDRTPMLCAAERFHRNIVNMLSPVHTARRLSPAARAACEEFKATVVDFGTFRDGKQHQVFKHRVFDVLYGWDDEHKKPKVATQTENIKYQPDFRWIHLPANNIAWVEWFIEGGHRDIEPFKALEKCFDQEHRGPLAHAHFMRTFCHRVPALNSQVSSLSTDREDSAPFPPLSEEPTELSSASTTANASTAAPGPSSAGGTSTPRKATQDNGEGSASTPRSENSKRKGKGELIAERHPRRSKRGNGPPGNPPGTKVLKAAARGFMRPMVWNASRLPPLNGKLVLFMPFLHYETDERRQRMSHAINLVRDGWDPPLGSPRDIMLTKGYLCNTRPLHPRRTLDQFFYHGIDTAIRDSDQVVYRYCQRHDIEKKVFMVDQLWLFVLSKDLVITCFPQRWDQPNRDPLNVLDGIIEETNAKTRPPIQSVYDLAMLITNRCSGMFDRYRLADQDYQFLDMFESSIGLVTNTESELFSRFNKASELSAEWLELHRNHSQRHGANGLSSSLSSTLTASSPSLVPASGPEGEQLLATSPVFPDALLDIGTETSLLAEIKDIRDELNILSVILASQAATLEEFKDHMIDELRPDGSGGRRGGGGGGGGGNNNGGPSSGASGLGNPVSVDSIVYEIRRRSYEQRRLLEIHRNDIARMDRQAESIYMSLTNLLDLKQKHSNALEARFARDHAMIAARQGQTIMTFTIVTIIFLPMSFIAAFFSIQIKDWENNLTLGYVSKYMFGIGLGISIPLVVMAFTVSDIYDAIYSVYYAAQEQGRRWHLPIGRHRRNSSGTSSKDKHRAKDSDMDSLASIERIKRMLLAAGARGNKTRGQFANYDENNVATDVGGGGAAAGAGGVFHGKSRSWSLAGSGADGGSSAARNIRLSSGPDRTSGSQRRYDMGAAAEDLAEPSGRSPEQRLPGLYEKSHQHQLLKPPAWAIAGAGGSSSRRPAPSLSPVMAADGRGGRAAGRDRRHSETGSIAGIGRVSLERPRASLDLEMGAA